MIHGLVNGFRKHSATISYMTTNLTQPLHLQNLQNHFSTHIKTGIYLHLRNSYLIPYRFNADGKPNPIIFTDESGNLLPEYKSIAHEKDYQHFNTIYQGLNNKKNIYFAKAYRYSHSYDPDSADTFQQILEEHSGVLLIRELPDTVKSKETEAEAYSALWDLMIQIEKDLPMAYVFYGQDSLIENDKRYDELGIFLPNSHFLKNLEKHVEKAEAIIYGK